MPDDQANSFGGAIPHPTLGVLKDIEYLIIMDPKESSESRMLDDTAAVVLKESGIGNQQQSTVPSLLDAAYMNRREHAEESVAVKPVKPMIGARPNGSVASPEECPPRITLLVA
jgi:hypothetical protein